MKKLRNCCLVFVLLLTGCMTPKGWVKPGDSELLVHEKTSLSFPEEIGEYKRLNVIPSRNPYVGDQVIYQNASKTKISVFMQPSQDAKQYFELSKIVLIQTGVDKAIEDKPLTIKHKGKSLKAQTQRGYGKVFEYKLGDKTVYMSQMESVSVFAMDGFALKIRSSVYLNPEHKSVALENARDGEMKILKGVLGS